MIGAALLVCGVGTMAILDRVHPWPEANKELARRGVSHRLCIFFPWWEPAEGRDGNHRRQYLSVDSRTLITVRPLPDGAILADESSTGFWVIAGFLGCGIWFYGRHVIIPLVKRKPEDKPEGPSSDLARPPPPSPRNE